MRRTIVATPAQTMTAVVCGEFGHVAAYPRKKVEIAPWLTDPRERVKKFAEDRMISLDRLIADEQRWAEQDVEMRKRTYGDG